MKWSAEDERILRHLYPHHSNQYLAEYFGRDYRSIKNKAVKLGLSKSPEYMASKPGCFREGQQTWNKGLKGWKAGGRSAETRFKPGRKPEESRNYLPIGSLRLAKDGYLERKVSDDTNLVPARRWTAVHRLIWEAEHGPIEEGMIVGFKPGMRTNVLEEITIDRLECISRAENMRRNTLHRYPKEIVDVIRMRGVLNRHINKSTRA